MSYLTVASPVPAFTGDIPLHLNIREMSDRGRPVVVSSPDSPEVRCTAQHSTALSSSVLFNHTPSPTLTNSSLIISITVSQVSISITFQWKFSSFAPLLPLKPSLCAHHHHSSPCYIHKNLCQKLTLTFHLLHIHLVDSTDLHFLPLFTFFESAVFSVCLSRLKLIRKLLLQLYADQRTLRVDRQLCYDQSVLVFPCSRCLTQQWTPPLSRLSPCCLMSTIARTLNKHNLKKAYSKLTIHYL